MAHMSSYGGSKKKSGSRGPKRGKGVKKGVRKGRKGRN